MIDRGYDRLRAVLVLLRCSTKEIAREISGLNFGGHFLLQSFKARTMNVTYLLSMRQ
jgi:hypothetical protein